MRRSQTRILCLWFTLSVVATPPAHADERKPLRTDVKAPALIRAELRRLEDSINDLRRSLAMSERSLAEHRSQLLAMTRDAGRITQAFKSAEKAMERSERQQLSVRRTWLKTKSVVRKRLMNESQKVMAPLLDAEKQFAAAVETAQAQALTPLKATEPFKEAERALAAAKEAMEAAKKNRDDREGVVAASKALLKAEGSMRTIVDDALAKHAGYRDAKSELDAHRALIRAAKFDPKQVDKDKAVKAIAARLAKAEAQHKRDEAAHASAKSRYSLAKSAYGKVQGLVNELDARRQGMLRTLDSYERRRERLLALLIVKVRERQDEKD